MGPWSSRCNVDRATHPAGAWGSGDSDGALAEVRCQQGLDASVASLGLRMAALDLGWNNGPQMDVTEAWRDGFY